MLFPKIALLATAILLAGCASSTQPTPTLSTAAPASPTPAKKGILEEASDATWRVVTAPAKLIPQKAPTATEPQTFDAPTITIVRREWPPESPATQPAHP